MGYKTRRNTKIKNAKYKDFESFPCCYCGIVSPISKLTLEHIIPQAFFKSTFDASFDDNIDLACFECNQKAGARVGSILNCYHSKLYKEPIIELKGICDYCDYCD